MIFRHLLNMRSHPTWVRGLKLQHYLNSPKRTVVAPYVGAWIETGNGYLRFRLSSVAPYVGAWIETWQQYRFASDLMGSHPTWVRGLKLS